MKAGDAYSEPRSEMLTRKKYLKYTVVMSWLCDNFTAISNHTYSIKYQFAFYVVYLIGMPHAKSYILFIFCY